MTKTKNIKAYSLLEMLVTLVIFAILMTMIVQVLLLSIESGRKIAARSKVRGDLSEVALMIRRDFRNAGKIDATKCGETVTFSNPDGTMVANSLPACFFNISGNNYAWIFGEDPAASAICPNKKLCKLKQNASGNYELYYQTSNILVFDMPSNRFELEVYQDDENTTQGILLSSLAVNAPANLRNDVATQYRQVTIFTRNF